MRPTSTGSFEAAGGATPTGCLPCGRLSARLGEPGAPPDASRLHLRVAADPPACRGSRCAIAHNTCITTARHSQVLDGTQRHTETAAQGTHLHVLPALTRRRSQVRALQRPLWNVQLGGSPALAPVITARVRPSASHRVSRAEAARPSWNNRSRVNEYGELLRTHPAPPPLRSRYSMSASRPPNAAPTTLPTEGWRISYSTVTTRCRPQPRTIDRCSCCLSLRSTTV